jgi:hypothetical protein
MTTPDTREGPGYHPGYWPWGDEPRPVDPTVPSGYEPPRVAPGRSRAAVLTEVLVAAGVWVAVAALMGWRVLRSPGTLVPGEGEDPFGQLWSLAWSGHALRADPAGVLTGNAFDGNVLHPAHDSLAFGDSLLGLGPLTWLTHDQRGLITLFGLLVVFLPALSALGAYALARQLGAHPLGAAVAGAAFGWAPWHASQLSHLGALATGPAVLALAMLARGHGLTFSGRREPPLRPAWVALGWLTAAFQLTIGWVVGLPFAALLAGLAVLTVLALPVRGLRRRRNGGFRRPRAGLVVGLDVLGALCVAGTGYVMAQPYLDVKAADAAAVVASRGGVERFSPTPVGLLTPPAVDGAWSRLWSAIMNDALPGVSDDVRWLPGVLVLMLAALGLLLSSWRWRWRAFLLLGAAGCAVLALGTRFPVDVYDDATPFELLRRLPGWEAYRAPGHLMVLSTLAAALLAAGAVSRLAGLRAGVTEYRERSRAGKIVVAALLAVLPVVVLLEGWVRTPVMPVPAAPSALAQAVAPAVVLPSSGTSDGRVMFWSIDPGPPAGAFLEVANGHGGVVPSSLTVLRYQLRTFPDAASVAYLRAHGFRSVVVVGRAPMPAPALGLTRTDLGDSVLFSL